MAFITMRVMVLHFQHWYQLKQQHLVVGVLDIRLAELPIAFLQTT